MSELFQFYVGGKLFYSTQDILKKSPYFESYFANWDTDKSKKLDIARDPDLFTHVLRLLMDQEYAYPEEFMSELKFWNISPSVIKVSEEKTKLEKMSDTLEEIYAIKKYDQYCGGLRLSPKCITPFCYNMVFTSSGSSYCKFCFKILSKTRVKTPQKQHSIVKYRGELYYMVNTIGYNENYALSKKYDIKKDKKNVITASKFEVIKATKEEKLKKLTKDSESDILVMAHLHKYKEKQVMKDKIREYYKNMNLKS